MDAEATVGADAETGKMDATAAVGGSEAPLGAAEAAPSVTGVVGTAGASGALGAPGASG